MPSMHRLVILFTRYPEPGKCKSRLIPALGADGALEIHLQLVSHILSKTEHFLTGKKQTLFTIFFHGGSSGQMQQWLGNKYSYRRQQGNDLGERMAAALLHGLAEGRDTILIGSDCPEISTTTLDEGLSSLTEAALVIGPAFDGGYYLIGVAAGTDPSLCRRLFEDIHWGSSLVFSETMNRAEELGLKTHILDTLHDIDTEEDLRYFHHCSHPERREKPRSTYPCSDPGEGAHCGGWRQL